MKYSIIDLIKCKFYFIEIKNIFKFCLKISEFTFKIESNYKLKKI